MREPPSSHANFVDLTIVLIARRCPTSASSTWFSYSTENQHMAYPPVQQIEPRFIKSGERGVPLVGFPVCPLKRERMKSQRFCGFATCFVTLRSELALPDTTSFSLLQTRGRRYHQTYTESTWARIVSPSGDMSKSSCGQLSGVVRRYRDHATNVECSEFFNLACGEAAVLG